MSILFFYIRIFTLRTKWFKVCIYATMAYVTGWALSLIIFVLAQWYDAPHPKQDYVQKTEHIQAVPSTTSGNDSTSLLPRRQSACVRTRPPQQY